MVYKDSVEGRQFPSLTHWLSQYSSSEPDSEGHLVFTSRMLDDITVKYDQRFLCRLLIL